MIYYTKSELLDKISSLEIREKDYQTISKILALNDDNLSVAILEEAIKGNLIWQDFEEALDEDDYKSILKKNLSQQKRLRTIVQSARTMLSPFLDDNTLDKVISKFAVVANSKNKDGYDEAVKDLRDEFLFELYAKVRGNNISKDISRQVLMNMLENGKIIQENPDKYKLEDGYAIDEDGNKYSYILPDDIFLWGDDPVIPTSEENVVLTDEDKAYMEANNVPESTMLKLIAMKKYLEYKEE